MGVVIEDAIWRTPSRPRGGTIDGPKRELFFHHAADASVGLTRTKEIAYMRGLYDYHVHTKGWSDIAYSYVCMPSGRIYRGRGARYIPAAQEGHNTGTRACLFPGTNPILSLLQRRSARWLVRTLKEEQGFTKLGGHRDVVATECPGTRIYGWVVKWREDFGMSKP